MSTERNQPQTGNSGRSTPALVAPAGGSGAGQWSVSTRSIGEVLTTEIRSDGLRLLLFSRPSEETARQIEARLEELLAADGATEGLHSGTGAVPAPLQHAVDVLLELVGDVERVTQRRAGALALYQSSREVACAYVGGGEPDVWSHNQRYEAPWVALRDGQAGAENAPVARGFAVFAREDLDMRLQWPYLLGTPKPEGVIVEACWRAPKGFEVTVRELSAADLPQSGEDAAESAAAAAINSEERGDFFAGWFDDLTHTETALPPRAIPPLPREREWAEVLPLPVAHVDPVPLVVSVPLVTAQAVSEPVSRTAGTQDDAGWIETPSETIASAADEFVEFAPPARSVRRPQWPAFTRPRHRPANWRQRAGWAGFIVALFAMGWWLGTRGAERSELRSGRAPFAIQFMRALGLASPRFTARIHSTPEGALILVDGKPSPYRTPAEIELVPGSRRIGLTLPDLGTATTVVEGRGGATVKVDVPLNGKLLVSAPNPATPVEITLDGEPRGFAPLEVKEIAPGAHELTFTLPGQPPWSQTVVVPLRGDVRIVARPFDLPASGVIHVGATWTDDNGSSDMRGAMVTIDGERRGVTPLTIELPRGPHSLRAEFRGETVPVQVIDLPGGNERYAAFSFGTGAVYPRLQLRSPLKGISRDVPTPVSVALHGLASRDVREVWLHVRAQDGSWRRYLMPVRNGDSGPLASMVFPAVLLDSRGEAPFYISTLVSTGEEYFTDIYGITSRAASRPARKGVPAGSAQPVTPESVQQSSTARNKSLRPESPKAPARHAGEVRSAPLDPPIASPNAPSTP